jgi:hypothetical protein
MTISRSGGANQPPTVVRRRPQFRSPAVRHHDSRLALREAMTGGGCPTAPRGKH